MPSPANACDFNDSGFCVDCGHENLLHPQKLVRACDAKTPEKKASATPQISARLACIHRGDKVGTLDCECRFKPFVFACDSQDVPSGKCVLVSGPASAAAIEACQLGICLSCAYRDPPPPAEPIVNTPRVDVMPPVALAPQTRWRIDETTMPYSAHHFQPSVIRYCSKRLMAYRLDWSRSNIHLCELDRDWQPLSDVAVKLPGHRRNDLGNEDPRLFVLRDKLWLETVAVERIEPNKIRTNVMLSHIDGTGNCSEFFFPKYDARREWEKNWGPFEHDGQLYAVYAIAPNHIVVKIDPDGTTTKVASTPFELPVALSNARGGAPPVLHDGEFYSWFHCVFNYQGMRTYGACLYTFSPEPPFKPLRYAPAPLLLPDERDRWAAHHPAIVFPCGALVDGDRWIVSYGYQDKWSEVAAWSVSDVESVLLDVQTNAVA